MVRERVIDPLGLRHTWSDDGTLLAGTFDQGDDPARHVQFVLSKVLGTVARVEGGD